MLGMDDLVTLARVGISQKRQKLIGSGTADDARNIKALDLGNCLP